MSSKNQCSVFVSVVLMHYDFLHKLSEQGKSEFLKAVVFTDNIYKFSAFVVLTAEESKAGNYPV